MYWGWIAYNMPKYLYVFAYQTAEQRQLAAREPGVIEESSAGVFIEANSPEEALSWGRNISGRFISERFGEGKAAWDADQFAHWIEAEAEREYPPDTLARLPVVMVGNYPDWTN
jgi:hypothetical protein